MELPTFKFAIQSGLDDTFLPTKATAKNTGWDVRCAEPNGVILIPGQYAKISLGFQIFSPEGWWLELRPRSSSFIKKNLHALYGVIDEEFPHLAMFCCQYCPEGQYSTPLVIEYGERIGQLIPVKRQEVNNPVYALHRRGLKE